MDYLQAFPSQMRIKGRLWQTNVFQDGSHETHLVFKVAGFKGMFELGRFSHLLSPLLIWENEAAPLPQISALFQWLDGQSLQDSWSLFLRSKQEVPAMDDWHCLLAKLYYYFFSGCVWINMRLQRILNITLL